MDIKVEARKLIEKNDFLKNLPEDEKYLIVLDIAILATKFGNFKTNEIFEKLNAL